MRSKNIPADYRILRTELVRFLRVYDLTRAFTNLFGTLLIFMLLVVFQVILNQLAELNALTRTLLWWSGVAVSSMHLLLVVMYPVLKRMTESGRNRLMRANELVTLYYPEIEDKLINTIELAEDERSGGHEELVNASIRQRVGFLRRFPFRKALNVKGFVRSLAVAMIVFSAILLSRLFIPDASGKGVERMIHFKIEIAELEKYGFMLSVDSLQTLNGNDFEVTGILTFDPGDEPIWVREGSDRKMVRVNEREFSHTIIAPNRDIEFSFIYKKVESQRFHLKVIPRCELDKVILTITPPPYTGIAREVRNQTGRLEVPRGSVLDWRMDFRNTSMVMVVNGKDTLVYQDERFSHQERVMNPMNLEFIAYGLMPGDSLRLSYPVTVVTDLYPEIMVRQSLDSLAGLKAWYQGFAGDDYGISSIGVKVLTIDNQQLFKDEIEIIEGGLQQNFYYSIDIEQYDRDVMVVFEVWDNDGVTGRKRSESEAFYHRKKSMEEVLQEQERKLDEIGGGVRESGSIIEKMTKALEEIRMNQVTGELTEWELQEKLKEISDLQMQLNQLIDEIEMKNSIRNQMQERFLEEELIKKAEMIQQLFEDLVDEEMKKLMEDFEKLLEEKGGKMTPEDGKMMEMSLENLKNKMDMDLELLKRFEVEKNLMEQARELDKISKDLENQQEDESAEEKTQKDYEEWMEDVNETLERNEELKEPYDSEDLGEQMEDIERDVREMTKSGEPSGAKQQKKREVARKMAELSNKMRGMAGLQDEMSTVDLEDLRVMVYNLNQLSLEHEGYFEKIKELNLNHPLFSQVMIRERSVQQKFDRIKDSLQQYGYRQPLLAKLVGTEMFHVETSFQRMWLHFESGNPGQVKMAQNKIMENLNDIAVKLDELLKGFENAKANAKGNQGFTDSKKSESGEEEVGNMKNLQNSMKEQLKKAIEQMQQDGQTGKEGRERMARMLGEREMMRRKMEQLANSGMVGKEAKDKLNQAMEMMNEVEKDIIYKSLGEHTLEKDEWITSRLLEAENAERERDEEEERESREFRGVQERFEGDENRQGNEERERIEDMKYRDIKLKEYYDRIYREYLNRRRLKRQE